MKKKPKVPQCVRGEVALTAASGFQFDESPTRWIERAHQRDAHAQYDEPVAHDDACKELSSVNPEPNAAKLAEPDMVLHFTHLKPGFWQ